MIGNPTRCTYCEGEPIQAIEAVPSGKMMFLCRECCVTALGASGISQVTREALEAALERTREWLPS